MLLAIRRHLSYANVVATMALVFAMGGSAIAAKHYLITSTGQISPKVLKKLEARLAHNLKPGAAGKQGATGKEGAVGKEGLSMLSTAEQATLKTVLPYLKYVASGVGGKPTIQFSGANVQIVNGAGKTESVNGAGNLIIGYDEQKEGDTQTGSHNLLMGIYNSSPAYSGIVAGYENTATGPYASVTGGYRNIASGDFSAVTGGQYNTAVGSLSTVTGGVENAASGLAAVVTGGEKNSARGQSDAILGGFEQALASNSKCGTIPAAGGPSC
jgi:hypothetical protein